MMSYKYVVTFFHTIQLIVIVSYYQTDWQLFSIFQITIKNSRISFFINKLNSIYRELINIKCVFFLLQFLIVVLLLNLLSLVIFFHIKCVIVQILFCYTVHQNFCFDLLR